MEPPSKAEILLRIQVMMKELFELDEAKVQPEARLIEDLELDSLDGDPDGRRDDPREYATGAEEDRGEVTVDRSPIVARNREPGSVRSEVGSWPLFRSRCARW